MLGKVAFLTVLCVVAVSCEHPVSPNFQTCKTKVDALSPAPAEKWPCMMGCLGQLDGFLNSDNSLNVAKKIEWGSKVFTGTDLENFKTAVNACQTAAVGTASSDICAIGNKIKTCMMANNAPRPPHHGPNN